MKRLAQRLQTREGFALIEALIALVVVAVGLLALAQFHGAALLSSADAKARTQATNLAQAKLDELKSFYSLVAFDELADSSSAETAATTGTDLAVEDMDWVESFSRTWTVTGEYVAAYECNGVETACSSPPCACPDAACTYTADPPTTENCHQKRIQTTVSWTDARGVLQTLNLESIIEGYDPIWAGRALAP